MQRAVYTIGRVLCLRGREGVRVRVFVCADFEHVA